MKTYTITIKSEEELLKVDTSLEYDEVMRFGGETYTGFYAPEDRQRKGCYYGLIDGGEWHFSKEEIEKIEEEVHDV